MQNYRILVAELYMLIQYLEAKEWGIFAEIKMTTVFNLFYFLLLISTIDTCMFLLKFLTRSEIRT